MRYGKLISTLILIAAAALFIWYHVTVISKRDTFAPEIVMSQTQIYVSVKDPEVRLLQGMSATDSRDGDVTDKLLVESLSNFISEDEPTRWVNYAAFDNDNHVSKASRLMTYTDYTPARFSLTSPMRFVTATKTKDLLANLFCTDCLDGDVSDQIQFTESSAINLDTVGDYRVEVEVTNSAGDTFTLPLTITLYDQSDVNYKPFIGLKDYLIYIRKGETVNPLDYLSNVRYKNKDYEITEEEGTFDVDASDLSGDALEEFRRRTPAVNINRFETLDLVNYNEPGVYEIQYWLTDIEGNRGNVSLIVIVEE